MEFNSGVAICLVAILLSGCGQSNVVGTWTCQTQNPNGITNQDTFIFYNDGSFRYEGGGTTFSGPYEKSGNNVVMLVTNTSDGMTTMTTNLSIDAKVIDFSKDKLRLETTMRRSGNMRSSACTRLK